MVVALAQSRCQDLPAGAEMEALKKRLTRAASGESGASSVAASARARPRRSALTGFQFRRAKFSKSLLTASGGGDSARVSELLESGDVDDAAMAAAVRAACERGHLDVLATLIRYGASINSLSDGGDAAPLHVAARRGYVSLIVLLIGNGANVDIRTRSERRSPLHVAAMTGHRDVLTVLLEAGGGGGGGGGANPDVVDIYGTTPLHLATAMGHSSVVEALLDWPRRRGRADVNAHDNDGWTALHLAAERGDAVLVELLLGRQATVDCQNKYGRTPLHWATIRRRVDVVELLVEHGASPTLRDLHDKRPLDYADDPGVVRALAAARPIGVASSAHAHSAIGALMRMPVRESFINRLSSPIPSDGKWMETIEALRHRTVPKPAAAAAAADPEELGVIAEEEWNSLSSTGSPSGQDEQDVDEVVAANGDPSTTKGSLLKALFAKNKPTIPKRSASVPRNDNDSDLDAESTSTALFGELFDSSSSYHDDDPLSSAALSRCHSPDGADGNNNDDDADGGGGGGSADKHGTMPEEAWLAQAQFQTLLTKVERHQAAIETIVRSVSESVQLAATGKRHLSDDDLKGVAHAMRRIDDLIFDFREDVDQQATLVKETIKAFLTTIEPRLSSRETLPVGIYHGFFHSVVSYLAERPHGHQLLVQKISGISEEKRSDMLQAMPSSPSAKTLGCGQAVYFALENTPSCYRHTPLLALLTLVTKCEFGDDATQIILQGFINITIPHFYGCLDQGRLFTLSHRLGSDGQALAKQLGVSQPSGNGVIKSSERKSNFERNLEILSRWRQVTASETSTNCVLLLIKGLILIGREDLLGCVLTNQRQSSKPEESDC